MSKRNWKTRFTSEAIEMLSRNPNVESIRENRLSLTYEFRCQLYDEWIKHPSAATIKEFLQSHGMDCALIPKKYIKNLHSRMKHDGYPTRGKTYNRNAYTSRNSKDDELLVATGKFVSYGNTGISFAADFAEELYAAYPEQSIEDGIKKAGIDLSMVGYRRIKALERRFNENKPYSKRKQICSDEDIKKYSSHPYVEKITPKQIKLNECFYNEASSLTFLHVNKILKIFEIEPSLLSISTRNNIFHKLQNWQKTNAEITEVSDQVIRIQYNKSYALMKAVDQNLKDLHDLIPDMSMKNKRKLFQMINDLPKDPGRKYTIRYVLKQIGVSKTCYYSALKNAQYCMHEEERQKNDERSKDLVQQVIDFYPEFKKGYRQVYMMMHKVTGTQLGLHHVQRIMRKYHMNPGIRSANQSRRSAAALLERNLKDNLLKRQFRLYKPNEAFESDVTYIRYDHGQKRLYGSACKDASTGVLKAFNTSRGNDLNLVNETVDELSREAHAQNAIFHTDQGALYLTDAFQSRMKKLGFRQSMSKRGNCWDNAPQESFFGHFKDEADLDNCSTDEEVDQLTQRYKYYYNNIRPQWSRKRMTPVEFESYLKQMTPEEYEAYHESEVKKYQAMKEKSAEKAKKRYQSLGV